MRRNRYMVDASRILIAAFDGRPGGTARTLEYAALRKLEIYTKKHGERKIVLRVRFWDANRPRSL